MNQWAALSPETFVSEVADADKRTAIQMLFLRAVGDDLRVPPEALGTRAIDVGLRPPLPIRARIYGFAVHGDTRAKNWRIQLWDTGPERSGGNQFDWSDAYMVYLVGWEATYDVWVVFDARTQEGPNGFTFNKTCFVEKDAVIQGAIDGYHRRPHILRKPSRTEEILVARPRNLTTALGERFRRHLTGGDTDE